MIGQKANKNIFVYGALISIGFILYFPSLFYDLTFLDDNVWLLDLHWYLKDFSHSLDLFRRHDLVSGIFYRPIIALSFMLNACLGGQNPFVYHLTNIIIHLINSCLVFCLLKKLGYIWELAFSFSLIFTVHPALTPAVAWIPGRTDSLLAVFSLISFIFFLDYLKCLSFPNALVGNPDGPPIKTFGGDSLQYYFLHLTFLILALLTKETAFVLPFVCLAYFYLIFRRKGIGNQHRSLILGWTIILALWIFIRGMAIRHTENINISSALASLVQNSPAIISYIGKAILPFNLSVLPIMKDTTLWYGIAAIILLIILVLISKNKRAHYIMFSLIWFFAFLWPALIFSFIEHEYRLYLPLAGCLILFCELDVVQGLVKDKRKLFLATSLVTIAFFLITWNHSRDFRDRMIFWESAVGTSPHSPLAHRNLGAMYFLKGDMDRAEPAFRQSLNINPQEPMAHNNLGLIAARRGKLDEALLEYKMEIANHPDYDNVYYNLGLLCYARGQREEAEKAWRKTIELNSFYIDAYKRLMAYYLDVKNFQRAAYYARELQKKGVALPVDLQF